MPRKTSKIGCDARSSRKQHDGGAGPRPGRVVTGGVDLEVVGIEVVEPAAEVEDLLGREVSSITTYCWATPTRLASWIGLRAPLLDRPLQGRLG